MELINKCFMYGMFYLVMIVLMLSFVGKRDGETEFLGREAGRELKGIAILMVLMGHMTFMMGFMTMPVTPALGAPAVDLFLFLSAFGLMASYEKKGLKGFISRRLAIIMIPYVIMTLIKLPYMRGVDKLEWKEILWNFTSISVSGDTTMWYIQYILLAYFVFFLIYSIPKLSIKWKVGILVIIGVVIAVVNGYFYYTTGISYAYPITESYSHHLSFPLGALFFLFYEKAKKVSYKMYIPVAIVAFMLFQFVAFPGIDGYAKYYLNNICYIIFFVAVFAILKHFKLRSKLLGALGDLAYYIYLNEFIIMALFFKFVPIMNGFKAVSVLVLSVVCAIPIKLLCEWILKKLNIR